MNRKADKYFTTLRNAKKGIAWRYHAKSRYLKNRFHSLVNNKLYFPYLVLLVTLKCTLNCRHCVLFTPYLPREQKVDFELDRVKKDIDLLASALYVYNFQLQGGEPLLHKNIGEIITHIMESGVAYMVNISTNGTVLLNDKLLDICKRYNVTFGISDYKLPRQKVKELAEQCRDNGLKVWIHKMATLDGAWVDFGDRKGSRNANDNEVQKLYEACPINECYSCADGLITRCNRCLAGHRVGLHPFFPEDFVNIRKSGDRLKQQIKEFVNRRKFLECCRYCRGSFGKKIEPGEQL